MLFWFIGLQAFLRCVTVSGRDLFVSFRGFNCHSGEENAFLQNHVDSEVYRNNGWGIFGINELNYYLGLFKNEVRICFFD